MTRKEIGKNKEELINILKEEDAEKRLEKLQGLAKRVGASITKMVRVPTKREGARIDYKISNEITESEIVYNIQVALQTHSMIDACRTAGKNFWIAVIAALAAWAAVLVNWRCGW